MSLGDRIVWAWVLAMHAVVLWACLKRGVVWFLFVRLWATFALYRLGFGVLCGIAFAALRWGETLGMYLGVVPAMLVTTWIVWRRIPGKDSNGGAT